jgi:hypothetical protein
VAASDDVLANEAIRYLSLDTGEAGLVVLRRLYDTDTVLDADARASLEALAFVRGWKRQDQPRV